MNRAEVIEAADREGIERRHYSLEGGLPFERYVLELTEGGWSVYYSERGIRTGEVHFDTEHEACDYLFLTLVSDPNTRRP